MFDIVKTDKFTSIFSSTKNMETASLGIFIKTGARYESARVKGIAHFLEHMLFKGSDKYPSKAITQEIEGRGGVLNGFTSQETTAYYSQFLSKNADKTLDILLDMIVFPKLQEEDIEKEKSVIFEEIKMHNDFAHVKASNVLDSLLWKNHPLGEDIVGSKETVQSITKLDLQTFKEKQYNNDNIVIVGVGDFNRDKLIGIIKKKMAFVKAEKETIKIKPPKKISSLRLLVEKKPFDQTHLCLGFASCSYKSKERLKTELLHIILGANMSSRLFDQLREKKALCYDISTEVRKHIDSGGFVIHLGLDEKNIKMAIKNIFQQLNKIKEKKVTLKELDRAKDYLLGQIIMGIERPQGRMFYLADSYCAVKRIDTIEDIKNKISLISAEDIRTLSQNIFNFKKMAVSCVSKNAKDVDDRIRTCLSNI